eukprot:Phypoly_transcript_15998.p1 GENE.Phypoly_transcript_15998~~Phypoly_transcript_15998.p1  ORF type:complete len:280 (+),score=45.09 Phypoly_transcript_15998:49-888(+)
MDTFQKIYPSEFYRKFLTQGVRPDGRTLQKIRKTTVSTGSISTAHGSAFVKTGHTSVVAGVRGEVGFPPKENQNQSQIIVNVELSPLCSSQFKFGKPSEMSMAIAENLNTLAKGLVPKDQLHFDPEGKTVWYLFLDIYCLDYDGNVFDAALIALIAALQNVQLPEGEYTEKEEILAHVEKPKRNLTLTQQLVPLSFAVFDDFILADPTYEEEQLAVSTLSIVHNTQGKLVSVVKPGGVIVTEQSLHECIARAQERVHEVTRLVDKACETAKVNAANKVT